MEKSLSDETTNGAGMGRYMSKLGVLEPGEEAILGVGGTVTDKATLRTPGYLDETINWAVMSKSTNAGNVEE